MEHRYRVPRYINTVRRKYMSPNAFASASTHFSSYLESNLCTIASFGVILEKKPPLQVYVGRLVHQPRSREQLVVLRALGRSTSRRKRVHAGRRRVFQPCWRRPGLLRTSGRSWGWRWSVKNTRKGGQPSAAVEHVGGFAGGENSTRMIL